MGKAETRDYRYERKFLVEGLDAGQVRLLVKRHPAMFYEPYPPRFINNLYLDSEDLSNYYANVAGMADRHKVRIRWYGDPLEQVKGPALEFKVKRGLVGKKHVFPFPHFGLSQGIAHQDYLALIRSSDLPPEVRLHLRSLRVVLCNRYFRHYFASKDQRFRMTIDEKMAYFRVRASGHRFSAPHRDHQHVVLELKYDLPLDPVADRIASFFPFIVTRNSKYITGIDSVY